jgi:hypothetical protein
MIAVALLTSLGNGKPGDAHTAGYGAPRCGPFAMDPKAREPSATIAATSTSATRNCHHGLRIYSSTIVLRMTFRARTSQGSIDYRFHEQLLLLCLIVDPSTSTSMTSFPHFFAFALLFTTSYHRLSHPSGCFLRDNFMRERMYTSCSILTALALVQVGTVGPGMYGTLAWGLCRAVLPR